MDDQSQPKTNSPKTSQSVIDTKQQPPKKNRTGLIIGIVAGSLLLIGIIAAVLWYFIVWQNPQNIVTNSLSRALTEKKSISTSKVSIKSKEATVNFDIRATNNAPKGMVDVDMKIKVDEISKPLDLEFDGIYSEDGDVYVKLDGLKESFETMFDAYFEQAMADQPMTKEQREMLKDPEFKKEIEKNKKQAMSQFDSVINKLDDKWIKISPEDMTDNASDSSQCVSDMMEELRYESTQEELANVYRQYPLLVVKDDVSVPDRNGAKGFEIDLDEDRQEKRTKEFFDELERTTFGSELKRCMDESNDTSRKESPSSTKSKTDMTMRVWADPVTHTLKEIEFKMEDKDEKATLDMTMVFDMGKTETVEVPEDATDIKDLTKELNRSSGNSSLPFGGFMQSSSSSHRSI